MIALVLQEPQVDVCLCGVHTAAHVRENLSASWTALTPERRQRLEQLAAATACPRYQWLEKGWRYA
jgi:aryl-alcohol dehydrogenase-like predicted oxidoreductase